jgi:hypothetical protein
MNRSLTIVLAHVLLLALVHLSELLQIEVLLASLLNAICYFHLPLFVYYFRNRFCYLVLRSHFGCTLAGSGSNSTFKFRAFDLASAHILEVSILTKAIVIALA